MSLRSVTCISILTFSFLTRVHASTGNNIKNVVFLSEEMTELKIQIETGFETEQGLKKSLQQLEGILYINATHAVLLELSASLSVS